MDDLRTQGSTTKDTLRSRLGSLSIFAGSRVPFKGFQYLGQKKVYLFMLASRSLFLMILGLDLDVWDWKTKHLARDVLQKSTSAEVGFLMIPGSIFHDVEWFWDQFS